MDKNSKIAVLGGGIEGLSVIGYLQKKGYKKITLCDKNKEYDNPPPGVDLITGKNYLKNLTKFEVIFRSPGIHIRSNELQTAAKKGIKITSEIKYFFDNCPCKIIGITGTKGKGTTSSLITDILKKAGKDVYLGGNIGTPPLSFLDKLTKNSTVVLELSSFQLQDLKKSPNIAVVLNVTSEHLDYHKSLREYREAKKSIVKYQKTSDFAVANEDYPVSLAYLSKTKAKKHTVSAKKEVKRGAFLKHDTVFLKTDSKPFPIIKRKNIKLPGPHNIENILPATTVAGILNIKPAIIKKSLQTFKGLPHRLEHVKTVDGVKYINDSFSTTPETSIAAINAFEDPIVVIMGGSEKFSDYTDLGKKIIKRKNVKAVVLMGKTRHRIEKAILEANKKATKQVRTLQKQGQKVKNADLPLNLIKVKTFPEAFLAARSKAEKGDIVLLSPACASFDLFKNYKVRGETFREAVKKLQS